jgi:hypothetical protein
MAEDILALFSNFTWVQVAALYAVDEQGNLRHPAEALLGEPRPVDGKNPLVAAAMQSRKMVAVSAADEHRETGDLLACAPICDAKGRVLALLAVERMPFMNFTNENLRLLAVLAAHVGHMLDRAESVGEFGSVEFGSHIRRALEDLRNFALPSTLLSLRCPAGRRGEELAEFALAQTRGLDRPWQVRNRRGESVLCLLMPLTSEREAERYVERLEVALGRRLSGRSLAEIAQRSSGNTLDSLGVRVSLQELKRNDSSGALIRKLAVEHHLEPSNIVDSRSALQ